MEFRTSTTLKKLGGATVVLVPADFRKHAGLKAGNALDLVRLPDGRVAIEPKTEENVLPEHAASRRLAAWVLDRPCGREAV